LVKTSGQFGSNSLMFLLNLCLQIFQIVRTNFFNRTYKLPQSLLQIFSIISTNFMSITSVLNQLYRCIFLQHWPLRAKQKLYGVPPRRKARFWSPRNKKAEKRHRRKSLKQLRKQLLKSIKKRDSK
jgi:hypothetical protein